jgi:activator of 2-hydroxyglutaryl-CoA dehydratase
VEEEVTFTGGVAKNAAMVETLNQRLGHEVNYSDESHYIGALGAALFALDHILGSRNPAAESGAVS